MYIRIFILSIIISQILLSQLQGQNFQFDETITVIQDGNELANPFAGGLNGVHVNWIDLDSDGNRELVLFDRSNNRPYAFNYIDGQYQWDPYLTDELPSDIQNWMITADFNNDGLNDIFTHTSFGVRVYENTSTENGNSWEIAAENLKSLSAGSEVNLVVTSLDYPAIGDFDEDGDIDILVFDFATGNFLVFYKNISVEQGSDNPLSFDKVDSTWGLIEECNCNDFQFQGSPCGGGAQGRQEHSASKSVTFYNNDLYIGIDGCTELAYLPNSGEFETPNFNSFRIDNFSITEFVNYPIAFFADFDQDGIDDVIVGNNLQTDGYFMDYNQSIRFFKGPEFELQTDSYIQETMIDLGEQSYPQLFDYDGDGDLDLFIGNKGEIHGDEYYSTIFHYENTGNFRNPSFELVTRDFGGLSEFRWIKIIPTLGDFNSDGTTDLLISAGKSDKLFAQIQYLQGNSSGTFEDPVQWDLDFSRNDTPTLIDWNNDGNMDLYLSKSFGNIEYYQNNGTNETADLELINNAFLSTVPDGINLFPTVAFYDLDDDDQLEIIKSDARGYLEIYQSEEDESPDSLNRLNPETQEVSTFQLGTTNPMVFGDLYNTGETYGIIGSLMGGVHVLKLVEEGAEPEEGIIAYPNPISSSSGILKVFSQIDETVFMTDISGKLIYNNVNLPANEEVDLPIYGLEPGLYILRGRNSQFKFYIR